MRIAFASGPDPRTKAASVLLEVVLALALFVGAATIISTGLNASIRSVDRVRLQNHAANLAITILSEMQMHARPIVAAGPEPFPPPFADWTFKIDIAQDEGAMEGADSLRAVEVIVRHANENVVQRLTQLFPASDLAGGEAVAGMESSVPATP